MGTTETARFVTTQFADRSRCVPYRARCRPGGAAASGQTRSPARRPGASLASVARRPANCVMRLPDRRPWLFSKSATKAYTSAAFQRGDVLVFGRETEGLTKSMLAANADRSLRIPMQPPARSLNLANAVAVVAFEALRQMALVAEPSGH